MEHTPIKALHVIRGTNTFNYVWILDASKRPFCGKYRLIGKAYFTLILTLCETCFASSGLTQDCWTTNTQHNCLSMAEHCCDLVAAWKKKKRPVSTHVLMWDLSDQIAYSTWTFYIHEVRVGTLNKTLLLVPPLLLLRGWVQQVFCELNFSKNRKWTENKSNTSGKKQLVTKQKLLKWTYKTINVLSGLWSPVLSCVSISWFC